MKLKVVNMRACKDWASRVMFVLIGRHHTVILFICDSIQMQNEYELYICMRKDYLLTNFITEELLRAKRLGVGANHCLVMAT